MLQEIFTSDQLESRLLTTFNALPLSSRQNVLRRLERTGIPESYNGHFAASYSEKRDLDAICFELEGMFNAQSIGFTIEIIPRILENLREFVDDSGEVRYLEALDVGSRTGAGASLLADLLMSFASRLPTYVDVIDIDPTFREYALSRWRRIRDYRVGDVFALPSGSYDYIVCSHTIEHLADPLPFCRQLQAIARRRVFVYCPFEETDPIPGHRTITAQMIDALEPISRETIESWWWRKSKCVFFVLNGRG